MISPTPTTFLTAEEIEKIAKDKLKQANAIPDGAAKRTALREAEQLQELAKMKKWLLCNLRSPR